MYETVKFYETTFVQSKALFTWFGEQRKQRNLIIPHTFRRNDQSKATSKGATSFKVSSRNNYQTQNLSARLSAEQALKRRSSRLEKYIALPPPRRGVGVKRPKGLFVARRAKQREWRHHFAGRGKKKFPQREITARRRPNFMVIGVVELVVLVIRAYA